MKAYLVRAIENHMIVGFFCVEDMKDLHYWVDSVTDPGIREYRKIESGGVVWQGASPTIPAAVALNGKLGDEDGVDTAMKEVELTESWAMAFYKRDAIWKPMGPIQYGPLSEIADGDA